MKTSNPEYLAKIKFLSEDEKHRLFSRMSGKLLRRLEDKRLGKEELLAIQMEHEDEQLQEWRKMMGILKEREETKAKSKNKAKSDK